MSAAILPRYPIYVPSKGRFASGYTANFLVKDQVPFYLVIEQQEFNEYADRFGKERLLVLPFQNPGSVIPARNWIKQHATENGFLRHWQLDDNMTAVYRRFKGKRIRCDSGAAFAAVEDFVDRYENVAIAGMNYRMFVPDNSIQPPFYLNHRVYSCSLVLNSIPHQWRGRYNEDTDICLQVLADNWCTVLTNVFIVEKKATMIVKGGNSAQLYKGDERLKMARSLQRLWPHVVTTERRFRRPQHVVRDQWRRFDTQLKLKAGLSIDDKPNEYGFTLKAIAEIQSPELREFVDKNR